MSLIYATGIIRDSFILSFAEFDRFLDCFGLFWIVYFDEWWSISVCRSEN